MVAQRAWEIHGLQSQPWRGGGLQTTKPQVVAPEAHTPASLRGRRPPEALPQERVARQLPPLVGIGAMDMAPVDGMPPANGHGQGGEPFAALRSRHPELQAGQLGR